MKTVFRLGVLRTRYTSPHKLLESSLRVSNVVIFYRDKIGLGRRIHLDTFHMSFFSENIEGGPLKRMNSIYAIIYISTMS